MIPGLCINLFGARLAAGLSLPAVEPLDSYHEERVRYRFDCAQVLLERGRPAC